MQRRRRTVPRGGIAAGAEERARTAVLQAVQFVDRDHRGRTVCRYPGWTLSDRIAAGQRRYGRRVLRPGHPAESEPAGGDKDSEGSILRPLGPRSARYRRIEPSEY